MKTSATLIAVAILLLLLPSVLTALDDFRTNSHTDVFDVTTAANVTTASATLSQALFSDATANAAVTSNLTTDAPIASTYTSATKVLSITGLTADASHRLTIAYDIDALSDYTGAGVGAKVVPLMLIFGALGLIVAAVYAATKRNED